MTPSRSYIQHSRATVAYLLSHYHRQTMREIAGALHIPARKLYELAEREGIQKTKRKI